MANQMKTRIVPKFDQQGIKFVAQAKKGWFWEVLATYRPMSARDEEECVRLCKCAIDRYLRSGAYQDVILYPEVQ